MNTIDEYVERTAVVIDDNDPDQLSKVKVRVFPELKDVEEDNLPWAKPYIGSDGTSSTYGKHSPPEIGSFVRIKIQKNYWNEGSFYYVRNEFLDGIKFYDLWANNIEGNISDLGGQTYPQPRFQYFPDGTCIFLNSETGETGIFHSSGSYAIFDKDGKPFLYLKQVAKIYNDKFSVLLDTSGDATIENDNTTFNIKNDGDFKVDNGSGVMELKSSGQFAANGFTVDP